MNELRHMGKQAVYRMWLSKHGAAVLVPASESAAACGSREGEVTGNAAVAHVTCPKCAEIALTWERFGGGLP